ncbi:MAG: hypothetical protein ASARMPREDX12_000352 [Alectoria sarmentosa]|nr:MAG: hypothetical protein ASARMPREDX12_000352 [Alectoria sarmentosa]
MVPMDPLIWSKMPGDIIFLIIKASDRATQISWSSTRRVFYNYSCSRIWSDLSISPFDIDGCAGNSELWWWPARLERYGKIHFMAKHARQQNKLARMGSYIESILVDARGDLKHALRNEPAASQRALEVALPTLLPLLPILSRCVFDGALYRETLSQLVQISNLKHLELRGDDWYLQQGCSYIEDSHSWVWRRWSDLILDFRVLANLKSLRSLKIGRLQHHEAQGLAEGVARLQLINLEIHSSPWVKDEDPRHNLAGNKTYDSPLMFFFYSMTRRRGPGLSPRGLPSTLETLILRDRFHVYGKPTKHIYLRAACRNCRSLRRLESTHPTREQACEFFLTFEWRPVEERFGKTKLASLKVPEQSLGKIYNGVAEFRLMPSPGLWSFAFVRDPDDVLESAKGYEKSRSNDSAKLRAVINDGNGKLNLEFRTIQLEKLT